MIPSRTLSKVDDPSRKLSKLDEPSRKLSNEIENQEEKRWFVASTIPSCTGWKADSFPVYKTENKPENLNRGRVSYPRRGKKWERGCE